MSREKVRIQLEPLSREIEVARGASLGATLPEFGVELPCGGTGRCGGCRVRVLSGSLPATAADLSVFSAEETSLGWRLACQARADLPLVLECGQWQMDVLTDNSRLSGAGKPGLGIAIDLGTTTIAMQMVELATGHVVGVQTGLNPQALYGADVMSRIHAALSGADLVGMVRSTLGRMIALVAGTREAEIAEVQLVGNTVMHHLFAGLDLQPLAGAPFASPHLGAKVFRPHELDWRLPEDCAVRFERCLGGFVGSDILAGIIAVGMPRSEELLALVDLGTNGEIAIGNRRGIVCTSTAAGPAFEAGVISMGMRAVTGAVSRVEVVEGKLHATVIGDVEPRGICGSGIVDAVAAGLRCGTIQTSGWIANGSKVLPVKGPVNLVQADVRELQLAKAAIASGFRMLLDHLGVSAARVRRIHLAGAFGNYVQAESAVEIGLLEVPLERICASGNTALRGAKILLLSPTEPLFPSIEHVSLAGEPDFQEHFASCMAFPSAPRVVESSTSQFEE